MSEAARGVAAMVVACTIWGLSAIYYKLLDHVPPLEVLAHRTLWSLVFFGAVLWLQGRLGEIGRVLGAPRSAVLALAAGLFISANWFFFIWSVQTDRAMEASLGYYLFPLVAVALGAIVLGERHAPVKWAAVGLAGVGVAVLTWGLGVAPWVSFAIAMTFGGYGLVKRWIAAGPVVSVATEMLLLAPLALVWLWGVHVLSWAPQGGGAVFAADARDTLLLMASGPLTAGPLILFSFASKRATYATIGLVQYLNPTLQFFVATLLFREPFGLWQALAFALIWTALVVYTVASLRQSSGARNAASRVATSSTSVK